MAHYEEENAVGADEAGRGRAMLQAAYRTLSVDYDDLSEENGELKAQLAAALAENNDLKEKLAEALAEKLEAQLALRDA